MKAEAISLRLVGEGDRGHYTFACPECGTDVTRVADPKAVALLLAAGVTEGAAPAAPELPAEDRSPRPDGAAFTLDDLIDLHFLLDDDAWLAEELSEGLQPSSPR